VYACENPETLTTDLRQQIGFTGFVMSDWGGTHSTAPAAKAGLDMEMGSSTYFGTTLSAAVSPAQLDLMTLHILRAMFAVGLFDHPIAMGQAAQTLAAATPTDTPAANALAGHIAEQGIVLLKNQGAVLPLQAPAKRIAVIGTPAGPAGALLTYNGGGSGHIPEAGYKPNVVSPLQGMQTLATPAGDVVTYADGSAPAFADAVAAAAAAHTAVVFAYDAKSEGVDQANLSLPPDGTACLLIACVTGSGYNQDQLIEAVAAANPNTVVVLETGGPILMPWIKQVKGVVEAWYPGQDEGDAIAAVLMGTVNPSGKLPQTFPVSQSDLPTQAAAQYPGVQGAGQTFSHTAYTEGLDVGYRWFDDKGIQPLFPFGYGLSYTTFSYSNLSVVSAASSGDHATVGFDVTNTGKVAGAEVAQLYVGAPAVNPVNEPLKQLRGYSKVTLQPGQTTHVSLPVTSRAVSYWDVSAHAWKTEPGCHPLLVGSSSRDIQLEAPGIDASLQSCAAGVTSPPAASVQPVATSPTALANTAPPNTSAAPGAIAAAALLTLGSWRRRRVRAGCQAGRPA
jgi:beta-glucosidase